MTPSANCLLLLTLMAAPGRAQAPPVAEAGQEAVATLEWRGQYGGEAEAGAEVLMHGGRWAGLWRGLGREAPVLDFTKFCVVVAHAGRRSTGGFTLEFLEPVPEGADLLIRWHVRSPAPDSYTTQAIAHPWKVKAYPRPAGRVRLERLKD